jgi:hypothetical protein
MSSKREFSPSANDHEAGNSWQIVSTPFAMAPPVPQQEKIYVTVVVA